MSPERKESRKVVAIFAGTADQAIAAIKHVRAGGVELPIHLYVREAVSRTAREMCASVTVAQGSTELTLRALRDLWGRRWVALGIAPWTLQPNGLALKTAPFLFPPFRVLLLNENGDFFAGKPGPVWKHIRLRMQAWERRSTTRVKQMARGLLAYPFAFVAQWNSSLSRYVFRRMRGMGTIALAAPRTEDDGVFVFEYSGREWDAAKVKAALTGNRVRWILFRQAGVVSEPVDEMIALFARERTFAVSRQDSFRGWRDMLFPAAPFRKLQRGESTRVFAPVSNEILVDRQKLLSLGVPQGSGYGSNWYLLFWKAAAAGWGSFSVAGSGAVREAVSVPFYEAQFVHALLLDVFLARLKPRDPLLARGNIMQRASGGNGFRSGLCRVMVLSPYLPYPLSHGGAVRIFNLCRVLSSKVDFVLVCFQEKNDHVNYDKLHEVFREVYVVGIDERHANSMLPTQVSGYESTSMRALIPEICFKQRIDLLQVEYTQMAAYRETVPHLPAILVEHDITFTLHRQLAERTSDVRVAREYANWLRFEKDRLRAFDMVWTMSGYDRDQALEAGSLPERTIAVPNGVDLERYDCGLEPEAAEEILYIGSFRHQPNYLGFEELRNSIMPAVWQRFPTVRLCVVAGPDHEKHWPGPREVDPRITVVGFVENLVPLYESCSVVVVPLPVSAGTNIKLMEALSCGRAVVTTAVGCIGLGLRDGGEVLIRNLGDEFAEGICELLDDSEIRKSLAVAGRRLARQEFGWETISAKAAAAYSALLDPEKNVQGLSDLASGLVASDARA